ncbi:MAG: hypothetical protein ACOZNI_06740 [Myxococcota bacterium]
MWLWLLACSEPTVSKGFDFEGGDFQFYTVIARDECLGGALEAIFMPEGPDERHPFECPIHIPSADELPSSYDIDLRDPFVGMPVTVEDAGDGTFAVRGSVMEEVVLDRPKYGDCAVTMVVDADLAPQEADFVTGEARIEVSDPRGEDELCPVFGGDPCTVTLALEAERL